MRKANWIWPAATGAALLGAWLLCRYALYGLHGMKDWPTLLAGMGVVAMLAALIFRLRLAAVAIPVGYLAGFVLGLALRQHGLDQGGGGTSSMWQIWGAVYGLCVLVGFAANLIAKGVRKNRGNNANR